MSLIKYIVNEQFFDPTSLNYDEYDSEGLFTTPPSEDDLRGLKEYYGSNVIWYGHEGTVLRVHKDNVYPVEGQIWHPSRLKDVKNYINQSPSRVQFIMGWGHANFIDFTDIQEQQEAVKNDYFESDYTYTKPASIGDDNLDEYIGDPYEYAEANFWANDETYEFIRDTAFEFHPQKRSRAELIVEFQEFFPDHDEDDMETIEEWLDLEEELYEAIQNKDGDLGEILVQMRDGNHRTFGAIEAGEEYVYVMVEMQHTDEEIKKLLI